MIRTAKESDLEQLLGLETACFNPADAFGLEEYLTILNNDEYIVRVFERDKEIYGVAILLEKDNYSRLYNLLVHPVVRGYGIAKLLMEDIIEIWDKQKTNKLILEVRADNIAAVTLYKKYGFKADKWLRNYYGRNEDGIKMIKEKAC